MANKQVYFAFDPWETKSHYFCPSNSNQLILEPKWMFVSCFRKSPESLPVVSGSQEWDGIMDGCWTRLPQHGHVKMSLFAGLPEYNPVMKRPIMTIAGILHALLRPIRAPPINTNTLARTSVPFLFANTESSLFKCKPALNVSLTPKKLSTFTLTSHIWWPVSPPAGLRSSHQ